MKITDIICLPVQAPGRTLVPVIVETDEGITGIGEAGLQRRWKGIDGVVHHLKKWLIGQDPMRIEYLWQRMFRGGFYPADRLKGSAIAGIDIALWDIKGQALGVPVYQLLGGKCRDYVQCFFNPNYKPINSTKINGSRNSVATNKDSVDQIVRLAKEFITKGHKYFRLSPHSEGQIFDARKSVKLLLDQLRAIREATGDKLELMVDLHARLDPPEAIYFCREAESLNLFCIEDPIRSEHLSGYRHLRNQCKVPLAAGEQWSNKWEFRMAIEEELIDYVRVDICVACGLTEAKKIASMAETHLIKILPHNPLGPICTAASLHLDIATDNAGPQEIIFSPQNMLPDVFECSYKLESEKLTVPTSPGIGVKFNLDIAKTYPAQYTEPPHYSHNDGSFTNC